MSNELRDLIHSFEEWISFTSTLQALDDVTWNSSIEPGKWTIKDIICHIMLWDKYFYEEAIEKIALGERITLKHLDYDEFNSKAIFYARTITADELIKKAIDYRKKIVNAILSLSAASLDHNYVDGDGHNFSVIGYLKDFIGHDQHHLVPIQEYLKRYDYK
ncbi:MAG: DinB family protein [Candidatus Cohnella colombiensis]|uniref:DinB family protein n=1 Tax=Candidatus Cohnella colombiensis TaxID=3121368 RepID=A0AA95JH34_9BACL|nr:MAG: DinB family protein [Cohnella sp.]